MVVFALYDFGDLVDLYETRDEAEKDAETLRKECARDLYSARWNLYTSIIVREVFVQQHHRL